MFHVKRIFAVLAVVLVLALSVVSAFAAPASLPPGLEIGGALSYNATITLANGVDAQMKFLNSSGYVYAGNYYAAFITARDLGGDQWMYRVYILPKTVYLSHNPNTDTNWLKPGASLIITPSNSTFFYTDYNFEATAGMGKWSYGHVAAGSALQLASNEQIVYCFRTSSDEAVGPNRLFNFGFVDSAPAAKSWITALQGFDGVLSWERIEQDVTNAYENGLLIGYKEGKSEAEISAADYWSARLAEAEELAFSRGEAAGYDKAVNDLGDGVIGSYSIDLGKIISAIPTAAKAIINNAFGFEVFGINVAGLLSVVLIISIVGFVVAKLSSR